MNTPPLSVLNHRTVIKARSDRFWGPQLEFRIGFVSVTSNGEAVAIAKPLTVEMVDSNCTTDHTPPTFSLMPDEAQQFMDELWHIGLRPTEGSGSAGMMAATERHLEDMRRLVFNTSNPAPVSKA